MQIISPYFMGHAITDDIIRQLNAWQPAVIKSLDDNLTDIEARISFKPKFVRRVYFENEHGSCNDFNYYYSMTTLANAFGRWVQAVGEESLKKRAGSYDYWESFNETGISESYCKFEKYRIEQLFQRYGLRACVLNSGVGWTLPFDKMRARTAVAFKTKQAIKHERMVFKTANETGLLETMRKYSAVFGVHSYGSGLMINDGLGIDWWHGPDRQAISETDRHLKHDLQWYADNPRVVYPPEMTNTWLAFRVARYHQQLEKLGFGDLKFIITEAGIDNVLDPKTYGIYANDQHAGGWRDWAAIWKAQYGVNDPAERFARDLLYAEKQYRAYSDFLEGATLFGGPGGWQPFNPFPEVIERFITLVDELDKQEEPMPDDDTVIIQPVPAPEPILGEQDVKFVSQVGNAIANDCGPICLEMWQGHGKEAKDLYALVHRPMDGKCWYLYEIEQAADLAGIPATTHYFDNGDAVKELFDLLRKRRPPILLVEYGIMRANGYDTPLKTYDAGHFITVIGMDIHRVYFYDPLHKERTVSSMPIDKFMPAWRYHRYGCIAPDVPPSEITPPKPLFQGHITVNGLRIRLQPDTSQSNIVGYKYSGQLVNVFEVKEIEFDVWWRIGNGLWIAAEWQGSKFAMRIDE